MLGVIIHAHAEFEELRKIAHVQVGGIEQNDLIDRSLIGYSK